MFKGDHAVQPGNIWYLLEVAEIMLDPVVLHETCRMIPLYAKDAPAIDLHAPGAITEKYGSCLFGMLSLLTWRVPFAEGPCFNELPGLE